MTTINEARVVRTFTGNGLRAWVTRHDRGYAVALQDIDTGNFLPTVLISPHAAPALEKARQLVR